MRAFDSFDRLSKVIIPETTFDRLCQFFIIYLSGTYKLLTRTFDMVVIFADTYIVMS